MTAVEKEELDWTDDSLRVSLRFETNPIFIIGEVLLMEGGHSELFLLT